MGMPQCRNSCRCLRGGGPASLGPPLPEDEDRLAGTVASLPVVIWGIACPEDELFEGVVTSGNKVSLPATTQGSPACGRTVPCRAAPHRAAPAVPFRAVPRRAVPFTPRTRPGLSSAPTGQRTYHLSFPQTSQHPRGQHLGDVGGRGLQDKSCLAAPTS